jgi:large subunit ribosomal protein L22
MADRKKIDKEDLKKLVTDTAAKLSTEPNYGERAVKTAVTLELNKRDLHAKQSDVRRFVSDAVHDSLLGKRFTARLRYARISERKMRLVTDQIRGKDVNMADNILKASSKRGAYYQRKLLQSALANATFQNPKDLDVNNLTVVRAEITPGPIMKRTRPSSERRPYLIRKRTCHGIIVLEEREPKLPKKDRGKKQQAPKGKIQPAESAKPKAGTKPEEKK